MPKQSSRKTPASQSRSEPLILGIEGGGTKTTWALVTKAGRIVATGQAGSSNFITVGSKRFEGVLRSVSKSLGARTRQVTGVGGAFAGCHTLKEAHQIESLLRRVWPTAKKVRAGEDTHSLMGGAFGVGDGIGVIAGTGSNVFGRARGRCQRAGGWGHLFSDAGSGYGIVREALEITYSHYDQTAQTSLLAKMLLRATRQKNLVDLCSWILERYVTGAGPLASFAPLVFEAARCGDAGAQQVIKKGAQALGARVGWLAKRLKLKAPGVAIVGSILEKEPGYRRAFTQAVRRHVPGARVFVSAVPGAVGAAAMVAPEVLRGFKSAKR